MRARGGRRGRNNEGHSCGQLCRGAVASAVSLVVGKRREQERPAAKSVRDPQPAGGLAPSFAILQGQEGPPRWLSNPTCLGRPLFIHERLALFPPSTLPHPPSARRSRSCCCLFSSQSCSHSCFPSESGFQSSFSLRLKIVYVNSPQYRGPDIAGLRPGLGTNPQGNGQSRGRGTF